MATSTPTRQYVPLFRSNNGGYTRESLSIEAEAPLTPGGTEKRQRQQLVAAIIGGVLFVLLMATLAALLTATLIR